MYFQKDVFRLCVVFLCFSFLAGCSGGGGSTPTIVPHPTPTATPNATPTPTPQITPTPTPTATVTPTPTATPQGSWHRTAPYGGIISNLTVDPRARNVVYAAALNSGIFKSTDTGQTWTAVIAPSQASLSTSKISSIAVGSVSSTLYFVNGTQPNPLTLYTSTDQGVTVSQQSIPSNASGSNLYIDPQNDQTLYLSGPTGVSKSINAGSSWTNLSNAPANVNVVRVDPSSSSVVYAGADSGLYKSSDGGSTWNLSSSGMNSATLRVLDLAIDPTNSQRIFASNTDTPPGPAIPTGHVYLSTNGGGNWNEVTNGNGWPGTPAVQLQLSSANINTLYAALGIYGSGVIKSTDAGASWTVVSPAVGGYGGTGSSLVLANTSPDILLYGALFESINGGASWTFSVNGISGFEGTRLAIDPENAATIYFAASLGGLWKSSDTGSTWANLSQVPLFDVVVDPTNSSHILASDYGNYILESTNGGTSFSQVTTPFGTINDIEFSTVQAGLVLACSRGSGIAYSTNNGSTWTQGTINSAGNTCWQIALDPNNGNIAFAATGGGIYKSSDAGASWTFNEFGGFNSIKFDPSNSNILYAGNSGGFFGSTDGGNTWNDLSVPNIGGIPNAISIDPVSHNVYVTAFGQGNGVALSTNGGQTWVAVNTGLGFSLNDDILVIPGTGKLFLATFNNGVLEFQ